MSSDIHNAIYFDAMTVSLGFHTKIYSISIQNSLSSVRGRRARAASLGRRVSYMQPTSECALICDVANMADETLVPTKAPAAESGDCTASSRHSHGTSSPAVTQLQDPCRDFQFVQHVACMTLPFRFSEVASYVFSFHLYFAAILC